MDPRIRQTLTDAEAAVLRKMQEASDACVEEGEDELVKDPMGGSWYLDTDLVSKRVVDGLLCCVAIKDVSDSGGCLRYVINETGRELLRKHKQ